MKKLKNIHLPAWFPYPSSWLKAAILAWFVTSIAFTIDRMAIGHYFLTKLGENRELLVVFLMAILLLPIPAIAFIHHLLRLFFHWFIPRFILPTLKLAARAIKKMLSRKSKPRLKRKPKPRRSPRFNNYSTAILPTLINWWEGLYSWLVFILSTIIAVTLYTLLLPWFDLSYETISFNYNQLWETESFYKFSLWISFALIWITTAAILYQIEHLFQLKLSSGNFLVNASSKNEIDWLITSNSYGDIDEEIFPIQVELSHSKKRRKTGKKTSIIDIHIKLPESQLLSQKNYKKRTKISIQERQKVRSSNLRRWLPVLILLTISVLAVGIYGIYIRQNSREAAIVTQISSPSSSQVISANTSPVTSKPVVQPSPLLSQTGVLAPPDPFQMAVNRATNAAEMTQRASSRIDWEAVASQWQDAVELMKVVPAFHPNYGVARQKAIEYQNNANYARRVAANSPE